MLKYTDTQVTFREIPDEITLCINISGCPIKCPDCHSKELWDNVGTDLSSEKLSGLIRENNGITCVCFMGGDSSVREVKKLIHTIRTNFSNLKIAWYSGQDVIHEDMISCLDYYKYGSYKKELGGLDSVTTNQKLFKIDLNNRGIKDITSKFWKNNEEKTNC